MKFGLQINPYTVDEAGNAWNYVAEAARVLDESGFDSVWIYDHFLYEGGYSGHPFPEPVLECFTVLGAVAAITRRIRLGQLVVGVPYRNPAMLAKQATSLDHISHGRSILGLGGGWHQREHEAYGWGEFEPVGVRLKRLREAIAIILAMWGDQPAEFSGDFYHIQPLTEYPRPLQKPRPPIMIGGSGEKVTLRITARHADIANVQGPPDKIRHLYEVLQEHCAAVKRPYGDITRSIYTTILVGASEAEVERKREEFGAFIPVGGALIGTPAQVIDKLRAYEDAGVQYVIFRTPDWFRLDAIRLFDEEVLRPLSAGS
ncbi:MAG: TIGR03560 family F420-dependent LLM class oxidoreductase [Chloroflexi bacterium]|nr:TIGR03560 family F420-dependent LLM class oxidoreductase [Chloroflexota bacterium]